MTVRLSYRIEGFDVNINAQVPEGPMHAADLIPVHRVVSSAITEAVVDRTERSGKTISCHKGCSACCKRLYVEVTDSEAYRLQDTILALPDAHRARVQSRFKMIRQQLLDAGLYDTMLSVGLNDAEKRSKLGSDFYEQAIACPFLEDDACSIYSERPLACREYLVTSPAEACANPKSGYVERISMPGQTISHALQMTQSKPDDVELIPLALLPSWLERNPEPEALKSGIELLTRSFERMWFDLDLNSKKSKPKAINSGFDLDGVNTEGMIVPDYAVPDALMVPHYGIRPIDLLENIAIEAARSTGVILLTPDPARTQAFIERQEEPERFSIVIAGSNTAWIRDREPIAVDVKGDDREWYLPRLQDDGRDADAALFETISVHCSRPSPLITAKGNLIAGPDGVALSTNLLLNENLNGEMADMRRRARQLGIHRWIVFTPFTEEQTQHADVHVRFLSADLAAVAWSLTSDTDRQLGDNLARQLKAVFPEIRILRIPMRSDGKRYASPLNWIQLGNQLIVPKFELTEEEDIHQITEMLQSEGFTASFIDSPTLDTGGSLHCLTASIYL